MAIQLKKVDAFPASRQSNGAFRAELEATAKAIREKPGETFLVGEENDRSPDRWLPLRDEFGIELRMIQTGEAKPLHPKEGEEDRLVRVYTTYARYTPGYVYTAPKRTKKTEADGS